MKLAILIASRNRPDLVQSLTASLSRSVTVPHDVFVVECGSDEAQCSPQSTLRYADDEFRGKAFGHHLLLQQALQCGTYDYVWVLMNDLVFPEDVDPAKALIDAMEREPRMAILSPTDVDAPYPGSARQPGGGWRAVTTCDYLGFMMRGAAIDDVGFLNPVFKYCWGAIHELSYQLHKRGWFVAYSDDLTYRHLGGSTYGAEKTKTVSREEYKRRASRFAFAYFLETYGPNWTEEFWNAAAPFGAQVDTYAEHVRFWAGAFGEQELHEVLRRGLEAWGVDLEAERNGVASAVAPRRRVDVGNPCGLGVAARVTSGVKGTALGWVGAGGAATATAPATATATAPATATATAPATATATAPATATATAPATATATAPATATATAPAPATAAATAQATAPAPAATVTVGELAGAGGRRGGNRMARRFERDELAAVPGDWRVGGPDFVGLGCGKSGGSWWYQMLLDHPQVVPNRLNAKELHYFCHQGWRASTDDEVDTYRMAFAAPEGSLCGEWSGNVLNHPLSVDAMTRAAPDAKFVVLFRNPVDRAVSNLNQFLSVRAKNVALQGEAADLFRDYSLFPEALWSCLVSHSVRQLLDRVPRERLLVLQYEAVRENPAAAIAKTYAFLGLDSVHVPAHLHRAVNQRDYVVERPSASERARLADYFADDVERLGSLLPDLDLRLWSDFAIDATPPPAESASTTTSPVAQSPRPTHSTPEDITAVLARHTPIKLLLGCGLRPKPGYVNLDLDPDAKADLYLDASSLDGVPDASVDHIESFHLFEHFTLEQAKRALRRWRQVLKPGGVLLIECPNLDVCRVSLGTHYDVHGLDLAMGGIYGPPERADDPIQRHNWGWTPESLASALRDAGFRSAVPHPIEQTWRPAAEFNRDMQIRAIA